jgi:hypothetical protein
LEVHSLLIVSSARFGERRIRGRGEDLVYWWH